ncbi:hypothetical protein [Acidocella sp.]|uniref:hypothetical protein n=1 Tax=Acidocella sp. TaxID=50710 RepID=UPI003D070245
MYRFTASIMAAACIFGIVTPAFAASSGAGNNVSPQTGQAFNQVVSDLPYTVAKMQNEVQSLQHEVDAIQAGQAQTVSGPRYIFSATPVQGMFPVSTGG